MHNFNSFQYLVEYVDGLVELKNLVRKFALDGIETSHVAVLHQKKIPVTF
jgi:hypothetical protein